MVYVLSDGPYSGVPLNSAVWNPGLLERARESQRERLTEKYFKCFLLRSRVILCKLIKIFLFEGFRWKYKLQPVSLGNGVLLPEFGLLFLVLQKY